MPRQSISFTRPNDDWLRAQVESEEYASKSEVVNDLIRKAREQQSEIEWVRAKLVEGENSGISDKTPGEVLAAAKAKARRDGKI